MLLGSELWPAGWVLRAMSVGVVAVMAVVIVLFFRSFRRWQQPPPGQTSEAARAESFLSWMTRTRGDRGSTPIPRRRGRRRSRLWLQDHDTTVLFGIVVTPIVGIRGPTHLHRVESEGSGVGGVRVSLHDVPSEDAEDDAVVGPRTYPSQGADWTPGSGVWQRARCVAAYRA